MPYSKKSDLPENLQKLLPVHAQEIYQKAFNNAIEQYKTQAKKRNKSEDKETIAHKVAWAAVKKKYKKKPNSDQWIEK